MAWMEARAMLQLYGKLLESAISHQLSTALDLVGLIVASAAKDPN